MKFISPHHLPTRFYAGIGSRKTPEATLRDMTHIAQILADAGYVLRSGHADGADQAFEAGAGPAQIFLPWDRFNYEPHEMARKGGHLVPVITEEHERIAREHHPNWGACSNGTRLLHMRNVCQILGETLDTPVDFVVCWTPNGSGAGGTG